MKTLYAHWLAALHQQSKNQLAAHGYLSTESALRLAGKSAVATATGAAALARRPPATALGACCPAG